ncbi:MAG TPA: LysR family transcriptional regulator [Myxococcota bacterium]|nr:LysR family transcriptional regulator [Myxococcota bacterium]
MELFELRYFVAVSRVENVHRASRDLHVSAPALSKAVTRLEAELGVKLFERHGRNIRLTDQGRAFQRRSIEIIELTEQARYEVAGRIDTLHVRIAGPEVLLAKMGAPVVDDIKKRFPDATFELIAATEPDAVRKLERDEAHLAIVSDEVSSKTVTKVLGETHFRTYVGRRHPLARRAKRTIPVTEVLEHAFVSPDRPMLGKVGAKQSVDGWRDDKFPRRIDYRTTSLKTLEELVVSGRAIAYLPSYFGDSVELVPLTISGCPYTCVQRIRLVARAPIVSGWLNQLF